MTEKMVNVTLTGSYGYKSPGQPRKYYGPGQNIAVPQGLARALGLPVNDTAPGQKSAAPAKASKPAQAPFPQDLPVDLPARSILVEAGIDTVEKLKSKRISTLTKIKGIGPATAKRLVKIAEVL